MKIKTITLLSCLFISTIVKSQNSNFGFTANIGFSQVTSNLPISGNEVKFAFSGNFGMFYELSVSDKSSIGTELLWVQIEGKEESSRSLYVITGINEYEIIGTKSDISRIHSSYIGVPVYFKYEIGKFGIKPGFQIMVFLFANSSTKNWGEVNGEPFSNESKTKNIKFDKIDYGPKLGIDYQLNERFILRSDFYYGIPDITSDEFPWERRNRQFTVGISYCLRANKTKE